MWDSVAAKTELSDQHRVTVHGVGGPVVVLANGLGGEPHHWDAVVAGLADHCTVVTFAQAGAPSADPTLFSAVRHRSVYGFVDDFVRLLDDLGLDGVTVVGHSSGGIVGALAACVEPSLIERLVLVNSSARYLSDPATGYVGGFTTAQVRDLRLAVNADAVAWSRAFMPGLAGTAESGPMAQQLSEDLGGSRPRSCSLDCGGRVGLDVRNTVSRCGAESLVLHATNDPAVPDSSFETLCELLPNARGVRLYVTGHFAHRVAPQEVLGHVRPFVLGGSW